jgi:hypothetical protein
MGVASNDDGQFNIKVPPGEYNILIQSLGFNPEVRAVELIDDDIILNVTLGVRYYKLDAVKISSKAEDPAYSIMRKAIGLAPYHQNQIKSYRALVYMKGTVNVQKLSKIVKRMLRKEEDAPKEGEIYVHESSSDLTFNAPNSYEQNVLSLQNTFPGSDNNDPMQFIALNLYQPTYSNWISPLAPNAFAHYRFKYVGSSVEADRLIHRIELVPRRKNQQLLAGIIQIVDNIYCIHSVDLHGNFTGGEFRFNSQFAELQKNLWAPVSHSIDLDLQIMGNIAGVNYIASVSYKEVIPNDILIPAYSDQSSIQTKDKTPTTEKTLTPKQAKKEKRIEEIMQKEDISTREMYQLSKLIKEQEPDTSKSLEIQKRNKVTVDNLAHKRDSAYWMELRPIPLKKHEIESFQRKDSLIRIARSDTLGPKQDLPGKRSFINVALRGGRYSKGKSTWAFNTEGIGISNLTFNPVDGIVPSYSFRIGKRINDIFYSLNQSYSFAISRKEFMFNLDFNFPYSPLRRGRAILSLGNGSIDFNIHNGINPFVNSVAALAFKENYIHLFHERWVKASNNIDLANGLVLRTSAKIFARDTFSNTTDFSIFYLNSKNYLPNRPTNPKYEKTVKTVDLGGIINIGITYTPRYYYRMVEKTKIMVRSQYPTFIANYNIYRYFSEPGLLSHQIQAGIFQKKDMGIFRELNYLISGGVFIDAQQIHFADFKHFNTQPVYFVLNDTQLSFCILPVYEYSTNSGWIEAHASYISAFMTLKYLPIFSNMTWKEALHISIFSTSDMPFYVELGYGFSEILQSIRVSGHIGYMLSGKPCYGFRIGISGRSIGI